jgi:citrate synthase
MSGAFDGDDAWLDSDVGWSTASTITVAGADLAEELMGTVSFAALAFRLASDRYPTPSEERLFNAVLVSLADHGMTPTALAARLTYTGAPESLQGAIASGLLGAGNVFLGVVEDTAEFLGGLLAELDTAAVDDEALRAVAASAVAAHRAERRRVPGLGHPVHVDTDPRVPRMYAIASEEGLVGPHLRLLQLVAEEQAVSGRRLPINGAGVAGAALADLGFAWQILRGFALLARTAGLLGHLTEEMRRPLGLPLWKAIDRRIADRHAGA